MWGRKLLCILGALAASPAKPWVVLYVEDWAIWQRNFGFGTVEKLLLARDLPVSNIVLQYAFFTLNPKTCEMSPGDRDAAYSKSDPAGVVPNAVWAEAPTGAESGPAAGVMTAALTLKARYPYIKIVPSVGGWSLSHTYHDCLLNNMDRTVESLVNVVRVYGFDGIDFDWEYPECVGGCGCQKEDTCMESSNVAGPGDWERYKKFTQAIRTEFDKLGAKVGKHLMITGAFGMNPKLLDGNNEIWDIPTPWDWLCGENVFDFMNLMTYDYYGPWQQQTAPLAPLYSDPAGPSEMMSTDDSIQRILKTCSKPEKLLIGLATYGKTWKNVPKTGTVPGLYQNSPDATPAGGGTYEAGTISYWDTAKTVIPNCQVTYHEATETNTAFCDHMPASTGGAIGPRSDSNVFISFEDDRTWKAKAAYAKKHGLGGAIIWAASIQRLI